MKKKKDSEQNIIEEIKKAFQFFDDSEDRVWVVDSNLNLIYGNNLFQTHASKIMGDSIPVGGYVFNDKVPEFYQKEWKEYFKRAFNGESFHVEVAATLTPKEEIIDYLFSPLRDEKADIFAVMISGRTVSASKHLEAKLIKNENLLNKAEEIADFGSWEFDLNTDVVMASLGARKIYGLSSEQWTIKDVQKIPLPEYRESLDLAMSNLIKHGEAYDLLFKIRRPTDLEIRDIHSRASYDTARNSVFGVIHDITEQKKNESDLFKAGILFKKIWDSSTEGMRLTDSEGIIIRVNKAFSNMFGKEQDEIIGKPLSVLYDIASGNKILLSYKEKIRNNNISSHLEKEYTLWNGKKIWFSVSFSTFTTDYSEFLVLSSFRDNTDKKQYEHELNMRKERYESLVQTSIDGFLAISTDGSILESNEAYQKMSGYSNSELLKMRISDLEEYESADQTAEHIVELFTKKWDRFETRHRKKDGTTFDLEINTIYLASQNIFLTFLSDITGRKRTEGELIKNREELKSYFDYSPYGIYIVDETGKYLEVNEIGAKLYEHSREELLNLSITDILPEESIDAGLKHFTKVKTEGFAEGEILMKKKSGDTFIGFIIAVSLAGNKFMAFCLDVSKRKEIDGHLKKTEERLRLALEASNDGLWDWNLKSGELYWSPRAFTMLGYEPNEFLPSLDKWLELLHPEDRDKAWEEVKKQTNRGDRSFRIEFRFKTKFNGWLWILGRGKAVELNSDGSTKRMIGTHTDISDLKEAEEALNISLRTSNDIIKAIPLGMYIYQFVEPDKLYLLEGNPEAEALTGMPCKEIIGKEFNNIWLNARESGLTEKYLNVVKSGKDFETEDIYYEDQKIQGAFRIKAFKIPGEKLVVSFENITTKKKTEEALKHSEERYRKITALAPFGIFLLRNGKYIYANLSGLSMLGLQSIEQLMNINAEDTFYLRDNEKIKSRISQAINGQSNPPIELEIKRTDGKRLISESTSIPIELPDGPAIMVMGSNVTERKLAEEALKNREEKLSSIFRAAPIGIGMVVNRVIKEANNSLLHITGYSFEELKDQSARMLYIADEEYDFVGKEKYKQISEKGTGTVETRWKQKNGRIIDIILSSTPLDIADLSKGVTFIAMDITERKKTERALAYNEEMLSAIAKATKELLTNRDTGLAIGKGLSFLGEATGVDRAYFFETSLDGSISYPSFSQKFEWSSDGTEPQINNPELQNVPFSDTMEFVEPLSRGEVFSHLIKNLPECRTKEALIKQNIVSIIVLPVFVRNNFYGFVGFDDCRTERIWSDSEFTLLSAFSDSVAKAIERKMTETDLEKTLQELKDTQKQILLQERLRSLGQMTSGICHDINNSLTPIMGYIDILRDDEELMGRYGRAFNMIIKSTEDIAHTISRLKEFYKLKLFPDELVQVNINKLLHETIELTRHRWKNIPESTGIVIEIAENYDLSIPTVSADESELREAVMNLILNACDAMPRGGKISIDTIVQDEHVFIVINDTGIGMDEETLARCFDPFYSTKGEKGTGLGLSMVFGIIERHKGEIKIDSKQGEGTTVKLRLPVNREIKEDKALSGITDAIKPLKILYVEDDDSISEMIKLILERHKHRVTLSSSGKKGLAIYLENINTENSFDLVITDLGMAEMDGISVSKHVKKITPDIPVILFTGWGALINHDEIETVDFLLKKPVAKESLFKAIYSLFH